MTPIELKLDHYGCKQLFLYYFLLGNRFKPHISPTEHLTNEGRETIINSGPVKMGQGTRSENKSLHVPSQFFLWVQNPFL